MMSLSEIRARDLRKLAYHEAGHLVVLDHFGVGGSIEIWDVYEPGLDYMRENTWQGTTRFYGRPKAPGAMKLVGLAGVIAEYLVDDPEQYLDELAVDMNMEEGSESDRKNAGDYVDADIDAAATLLRSRWQDVVQIAECEIAKWGTDQ
ncbi:MAG: hypothetical protein WD470_09835 [Rhodospirillaceae bacterium]